MIKGGARYWNIWRLSDPFPVENSNSGKLPKNPALRGLEIYSRDNENIKPEVGKLRLPLALLHSTVSQLKIVPEAEVNIVTCNFSINIAEIWILCSKVTIF